MMMIRMKSNYILIIQFHILMVLIRVAYVHCKNLTLNDDLSCNVRGLCQGEYIDQGMSLQKRGCWLNCVDNEKCAWFSYNPISTDCLLFESCSEIEENDLFFTGQKECEYSSIKSKLLVVTGYPVQNGQHAEVLDLLNPEAVCDPLPSINKLISFGSGGLIHDNFPLICGGTGSPKVCRILGSNDITHQLEQDRTHSASVVLNNSNTLWITGGGGLGHPHPYTVWISLGQPAQPGPNLPMNFGDHCMTNLNDSHVLVAGGFDRKGETILVDTTDGFNYTMTTGPTLLSGRYGHACATFEHEGKPIVITVGGFANGLGYLDSSEIWDPESNEGWVKGPQLPNRCGYPSMVTSPDGQGVILLGCAQSRESIFQLTKKNNGQFSWNILPQKIQNPRYGSVAMLIPDEFTNCK